MVSSVMLLNTTFPNPWMDSVHIWSDDRYRSKVFLGTIPTPAHGLKVNDTDLEVCSF